ncbi:peptidase S8/S53 domain-containing protein [Tribonema minus]|uniref:subtilisin n=1 Tax=Tribonema minus TaxID=303371 RepID=A0A835ZD93_9STRA|nr:peptidase S8/S53 domain-containing protein [Tribonema minus]
MAAPGGNAGLILNSNNSKCRVKELKGAKVGCSALDWIYAACCYNKKSGFYSSWLLGTSASAPFVSGVAALITSQAERRLKPTQMARRLRMATDDVGQEGPDPLFGYGVIDASKILRK